MTEAEALESVHRTIAGIALAFADGEYLVGQDGFLVGDRNADVIIDALHAAGWSWVKR